MADERAEAVEQARRWCTERGADVSWDDAEARCRVRVRAFRGDGTVEGSGAGQYEAYVECRVRYEAANAPHGPPSWF